MADLTGGNLAASIRGFLAVRNAHVRDILAAYRPRPVPWSPGELAAAHKRRRARAVVAGVVAALAGERLPLEIGLIVDSQTSGPDLAVAEPQAPTNTHGQTGNVAGRAAQAGPDTRTGENETILTEAGREPVSEPRCLTVHNRRPYPCWLCPDPACPANRPGHQLYLRQRDWRGEKAPRCQGHCCGREMVLVGAGETYIPGPEGLP